MSDVQIYTLDDLRELPPDPGRFAAKPIIPEKGIVMICAPPKAMKSMVALHIAYDLCEGEPVFGLFGVEKAHRVLYFDQEGGVYLVQERMLAMETGRKGFMAGNNFATVPMDLRMKLDTPAGLARIKAALDKHKPNVAIFDPLVYFHSQEENSNSEMHDKVVAPIAGLNRDYGMASVVIHHFNKSGEFRSGYNPERIRGAGTLWADADTFIGIQASEREGNIEKLQLHYSLRSRKKPPPTVLSVVPVGEELCYLKLFTRGER